MFDIFVYLCFQFTVWDNKQILFYILKKTEIDSTNKELKKLKESSTRNDNIQDTVTGRYCSNRFKMSWCRDDINVKWQQKIFCYTTISQLVKVETFPNISFFLNHLSLDSWFRERPNYHLPMRLGNSFITDRFIYLVLYAYIPLNLI